MLKHTLQRIAPRSRCWDMPAAAQTDVTDPLAVFGTRRRSRLETWQRKLLFWITSELMGVTPDRVELMAYTPFFELLKVLLHRSAALSLADHDLFREVSRMRVIGEAGQKREPPLFPLDRERLRAARETCHAFADQYDPDRKLLRGPARPPVRKAA